LAEKRGWRSLIGLARVENNGVNCSPFGSGEQQSRGASPLGCATKAETLPMPTSRSFRRQVESSRALAQRKQMLALGIALALGFLTALAFLLMGC